MRNKISRAISYHLSFPAKSRDPSSELLAVFPTWVAKISIAEALARRVALGLRDLSEHLTKVTNALLYSMVFSAKYLMQIKDRMLFRPKPGSLEQVRRL
jgi:hypothetical protein